MNLNVDGLLTLLPGKNLLMFLAAAYVWQKAKNSTLSPGFVCVLAIAAALATNHVLIVLEVLVGQWIT